MLKAEPGLRWQGLTHPFTWMMVAVLIVNDLVIKPFFPSWVSGKLSDLAWVYLLSLLAYTLLAACLRGRMVSLTLLVGSLPAVGLFGLGKTMPLVNQWIITLQQLLLPFESHFVLDPGDALALLMIFPAMWVWASSWNAPRMRARRLVILPIMLLAALGDAAAPQYGIACLQNLDDGSILAYSPYQYNAYISKDGGFRWDSAGQQTIEFMDCQIPYHLPGEVLEYPIQNDLLVRFEVNQRIQESRDGGQTWNTVYTMHPPTEAKIAFLKRNLSSYEIVSGPLAILEDTRHGTVIAAMGVQGVLVRNPEGVWQAISTGEYAPFENPKLSGFGSVVSMIWVEWLLSFLAGIFLVSLYSLRWTKRWWRMGKVIAAWLGWSFLMVMSPALADNYLWGAIVGLGVPVASIWAIFCLVDDLLSWRTKKAIPRRRIGLLAGSAVLSGMLTYVLWATDLIQSYVIAQAIVFGLMLIFAIVGTIWSGKTARVEETHE